MNHQTRIVFSFLRGTMGRLRMPFAILILLLILNLPTDTADFQAKSFIKLPIELLAVVFLLILVRGRYFRTARLTVTSILSLILLLRLADIATYAAFSRQFNPVSDAKLLFDGWIILTGTLGLIKACAIALFALLSFMALAIILYWSLGAFRTTIATIPITVGMLLAAAIAVSYSDNKWVDTRTFALIGDRIALVQKSLSDKETFGALLEEDTVSDIPLEQRFDALKGKDVIVIFIESYGESAIRDPRYSDIIGKRLANVEQQISAAGLASKSSWLLSPTSGGLSWLAHGTLLSGVWVDSQQRYNQLIDSKRPSLNRLFQEAGWRSVAVMPAITMDWPEGNYFGYDTVYAANNLVYLGKPFNWVTMPDQYTLSAFQKLERTGTHKPLMAEIALISSHAPWTPIPRLLDWSVIGDGTIFNEQAVAGESPEVVWRDQERVRTQYVASIDYTLETLASYMTKYGSNTVFILLGDHQPAPIITGNNASLAVPIHIISDDSTLLERLDAKKWNSGMMPGTQAVVPMNEFRQELIEKFSNPS